MVVVISDAIFVKCRGACGLDAANQALFDQDSQRVIYGLARDRSNFATHQFSQFVGGAVRMFRDDAEHCQPLCRYLQAVSAEQLFGIRNHRFFLCQILDSVKNPFRELKHGFLEEFVRRGQVCSRRAERVF